MIDVRDNSYTDRSPCEKCPRHLQGLSKDSCIAKCQRLAAYRSGEVWEYLEWVEITDDDPEKTKENKEVVVMSENGNDNQTLVCVICHDKDKKILNKRSETCGLCYQRWIKGKVVHPILGKFTSSQKSKYKPPMLDKLPPLKNELQVVNKSFLRSMTDKITKEIMDKINAGRVEGKLESVLISDAGLVIDLDKYMKIKSAVYDAAEKSFVTPEHIIIGLLGEALAGREGKECL